MRLTLFIVAASALGAQSGCSGDDNHPGWPSEESGRIDISLMISSGLDISRVDYVITGNGIVPVTGSISDPRPKFAFLNGGIPEGTGYLVALTAISRDEATTCAGSSAFDVVAGSTTVVSVELQCRRTSVEATADRMVAGNEGGP